jgi:hypothetical protein
MKQMLGVVQPVAREMHALGMDRKKDFGDDILLMPRFEPER